MAKTNSDINNSSIDKKDREIQRLNEKIKQLESENRMLRNDLIQINSAFWWKLTKPFRILVDGLKTFVRRVPFIYKPLAFIKRGIYKLFHNEILPSESFNIKKFVPSKQELENQKNHEFPLDIKFSILVPLYNTPEKFLREMVKSVTDQTYGNWELCLADGSDEKHPEVKQICKQLSVKDKRIKYKLLDKNMGISGNTNACLDMAAGDYIVLFDHDDYLAPNALFENMRVICEEGADFIYSDEVKFSSKLSDAFEPHFKPDFSIDNLRANNYICHLSVFSKELSDKVGKFDSEFDGSQDHDYILRLTEQAEKIVHIPKILYYWRCHAQSTAANAGAKTYTSVAGVKAVEAHLKRSGIEGEVVSSPFHPNIYNVNYKIKGNPLISIIIPNMDHVDDLKTCIDSILKKSTYDNYEIIVVENNSKKSSTFEYYKKLEQNDRIKVVKLEINEFNYPKINNYGFKFIKGEYVILLNNDIEVISHDWMEQLLMYAQRSDVGAVGAKLYYPNDTIQHVGVIIGMGGIAGHCMKHFARNHPGYFGRAIYSTNLSSVTGACMMVPTSVYKEVNGLDELFAVAFNDVDFCLRIREAGYNIVENPLAELYHHESISRGYEDSPKKVKRFQSECYNFSKRWSEILDKGDPYYNVNLALDREDFSVRRS